MNDISNVKVHFKTSSGNVNISECTIESSSVVFYNISVNINTRLKYDIVPSHLAKICVISGLV